jgi:hypothetical protein
MFGAADFNAMNAARAEAKPDTPLFLENHREGSVFERLKPSHKYRTEYLDAAGARC